MGHENLKNALQQAGLTAEELADIIRVDPKSVQRWLTGPTKPYPRHRAKIARALNLTEDQLWPEDSDATASASVGAGPDAVSRSEATGTWGYATDATAPDPVEFISTSDGAIDLLDNGRGIELTATLRDTLVAQAEAGRSVRLLTCLPKPQLEPLISYREIEIRVLDGGTNHSVVRVGDAILLTFNLADEADQPPPLLKVERTAAGGIFDRLAENFETLWDDETTETLKDAGQLDNYLTNTDDDDMDEDRLDPAGQEMPHTPEQTQRRWPRRPG
jgi:transcriptional regulator with XRE-family HTH domain